MKTDQNYHVFRRAACYLLPALLALVSLPCKADVPAPPAPPAVPAGYCQTINNELTSDLNAFNTSLSAQWNGTKFPTLYAGNLMMANGNTGLSLLNSTQFVSVQNELVQLQAMGFQGVMIQVGFPILYQPFYGSNQTQYQQFVSFYAAVAALVRSMGMKIVIENDGLLSNDAQAGWTNTAAFFGSLSWTDYEAARATMAATVAQVIQPDYLVLGEEPDSEATQSLQPNMNIPADAAEMMGMEIAAVRALNLPVKVGAGFGSWVANLSQYISDYVALPLDYIDFHIYPINTVNGQSLIGNALSITNAAAAAGLPVAMSEVWLWKMENSEWLQFTPDQYLSRESWAFWEPTNILFFQTMQNLANATQMLYQSPSEPSYYNAYEPYGGTVANGGAATCMCNTTTCTTNTIITSETQLAQTAALASTFTGLGVDYYNQLVTQPDTTPPSTPTGLTGTAPTTTAYLSWNPSTDNIGIAGYNIIRNGVWVANSGATTYNDANLATSTTFTYQVQAFDMAGNTSPSSTTISVSTEYTIPPTTPSNLTATAYSTQGVTLTWTASQSAMGISSYLVFRGTTSSNLVQVGVMNGTTTTYSDTALTPGTKYFYGIEATQGANTSAMSPLAVITTPTVPTAPSKLAATAVSAKQVNLTWTGSTASLPIAAYQVFRGTSSNGLTQIGTRNTPSYTDYAVTASTTYYYQVQATDTSGDISPMSPIVSVTTLPLPNTPSNVAVTPVSAKSISVSWSDTVPPQGLAIANYQVNCGLSTANMVKVATVLKAPYVYTGLAADTTYYCAIVASDTANDLSVMSAIASATTLPLPNTPANVAATPTSPTKISVSWSDTVPPQGLAIANYQVYCGLSPANTAKIATVLKPPYVYSGLTANTTYYCGIVASDTANDLSAMSAIASATTLPLPNAPTNVAASPTSATKISVTWTETIPPNGLAIANYQVYCGLTPASMAKVGAALKAPYVYSGLTPNTTYYCAVVASDTAGDLSAMSAPTSATTDVLPVAPTNVVATANSATRVTVTWVENTPPNGVAIANYQVYRGTSPGNLSVVATRATTSYTDTTVTAGTYYYAITATDKQTEVSPMSSVVSVVVP